MTLGTQLKSNIERIRIEAEEAAERARKAEEAKLAKERSSKVHLVERIKNQFILDIEEGNIPKVTVKNYNDQSWIKSSAGMKTYGSRDSTNSDVWHDFAMWAASEGMTIKIIDDHDGVGIESWIVISAEPV